MSLVLYNNNVSVSHKMKQILEKMNFVIVNNLQKNS